MPCSMCGKNKSAKGVSVAPKTAVKRVAPPQEVPTLPIMAAKSASDKLVNIVYKGGGMAAKREGSSGCKTCGGSKSRYQVVTVETIMFVSEDAPNGIFKQTFSVGHDYWVTEEQAKYLLEMTYKDMAGKVKHKFEEIK